MPIYLNEKIIPGFGHKIGERTKISADDKSGSTSKSVQSEKGIKPSDLGVKVKVLFSKPDDLATIKEMATAVDKNNIRIVYKIKSRITKATRVNYVQFAGDLVVQEEDAKQCWNISFTLREIDSVAEQKERKARGEQVAEAPADQSSEGEAVGEAEDNSLAKKIDDFLGGTYEYFI